MAVQVIMPRVGISVESCIITKWHKQQGEPVLPGDVLFSYETDKATADEEAKEAGTVLAILAQEGDEVPVLQTVCVIGEPGEDTGVIEPVGAVKLEPEAHANEAIAAQTSAAITQAAAAPAIPIEVSARQRSVSPRARQLARKAGMDLRTIAGTGPEGRVIERDVRAAQLQNGVMGTGIGGRITAADMQHQEQMKQNAKLVPLSHVRKVIANAMVQSLSSMAQLTNHHSFDASAILQFRKALKANADPALAGITLNDIILYAVAKTLRNHRDLNAHLIDAHMQHFDAVHLGIAVDTPRGLLVPTLFHADTLSLQALSIAAKQLAKEAQAGTISPDLLQGGTFTVSNLGVLGVESFTPVINPPQTGILGVCSIVERVRAIEKGIAVYPAMGLSLTYDHRAVDGAPAARFAMELKEYLENWNYDETQ